MLLKKGGGSLKAAASISRRRPTYLTFAGWAKSTGAHPMTDPDDQAKLGKLASSVLRPARRDVHGTHRIRGDRKERRPRSGDGVRQGSGSRFGARSERRRKSDHPSGVASVGPSDHRRGYRAEAFENQPAPQVSHGIFCRTRCPTRRPFSA